MCVFIVPAISSALVCVSPSGMIFERYNTDCQEYVSSFFRNLAQIAVQANFLLASAASIVFMLIFAALHGTAVRFEFNVTIPYLF